jgi:hypothetical protein
VAGVGGFGERSLGRWHRVFAGDADHLAVVSDYGETVRRGRLRDVTVLPLFKEHLFAAGDAQGSQSRVRGWGRVPRANIFRVTRGSTPSFLSWRSEGGRRVTLLLGS